MEWDGRTRAGYESADEEGVISPGGELPGKSSPGFVALLPSRWNKLLKSDPGSRNFARTEEASGERSGIV